MMLTRAQRLIRDHLWRTRDGIWLLAGMSCEWHRRLNKEITL